MVAAAWPVRKKAPWQAQQAGCRVRMQMAAMQLLVLQALSRLQLLLLEALRGLVQLVLLRCH
jgi:hypothetical protein